MTSNSRVARPHRVGLVLSAVGAAAATVLFFLAPADTWGPRLLAVLVFAGTVAVATLSGVSLTMAGSGTGDRRIGPRRALLVFSLVFGGAMIVSSSAIGSYFRSIGASDTVVIGLSALLGLVGAGVITMGAWGFARKPRG